MSSRLGRAAMFLTVFFLTAGFDQGSKEWARTLPAGPHPVVEGYWDWELGHNTGAAFSSFAGNGAAGQILLSLLALGALVFVGVAAARTRPEQRLQRVAYALIAGGAVGNLIDRVRLGGVTDFIAWHWHEHRWPIFNVADVALVVGIGMLALAGMTEARNRARPA